MSKSRKLLVDITRRGDTLHFHASNGGEFLAPEDSIQLQMLEYQATNTRESLRGASPVVLPAPKRHTRPPKERT
jgi:hypothetical protein